MNKTLLAAALCITIVGQTRAQTLSAAKGDSVILYTSDVAFNLTAPHGWVLDGSTGRAVGVLAVLYQRAESWSSGPAVMYVNAVHKTHTLTLKQVIANDIADTRKGNSHTQFQMGMSLPTGTHTQAIVYNFSHVWEAGAREQVAFVDTPKAVLVFVLTAHDADAFSKAAPDFAVLVHSYGFHIDHVQIKRRP